MEIRRAESNDWPAIWPIWHEIVAAGETYTWDPATPEPVARDLWMLPPPAEVFVAVDSGQVLGTAVVKPNQPGLGNHVSNASFMVSGSAAGRGVGRALAEHVLTRARDRGFHSMQFNAVVTTNTRAIALWRALGFDIIGTVPEAFRHPTQGLVGLHVMFRTL